jgi:hypothetical protein
MSVGEGDMTVVEGDMSGGEGDMSVGEGGESVGEEIQHDDICLPFTYSTKYLHI